MSEAGLTVMQWLGHKGGCVAHRRRLERWLAALLAEMEARCNADTAVRKRAEQLAGRLRTIGGWRYSWQNILVLLAQAKERGVTLTQLARGLAPGTSAGGWCARKRARSWSSER
jgi:hypothetical protein